MTFSDNASSDQIESLSAPRSFAEYESRIHNFDVCITESTDGPPVPAICQTFIVQDDNVASETITTAPSVSDLGDEDAISLRETLATKFTQGKYEPKQIDIDDDLLDEGSIDQDQALRGISSDRDGYPDSLDLPAGPAPAEHYITQLRVGFGNMITRYTSESTLTYNFDRTSFISDADYCCVETGIRHASGEWNKLGLGPTFQRIGDGKEAFFKVIYHGPHPSNEGVYAKSFFPHSPASARVFIVYPLSLTDEHKPFVSNISLHELGHILGFRHEFAGYHPRERDITSVRVGREDRHSVMNYFDHPRKHTLTDLDKEGAHRLYDYTRNTYKHLCIVDVHVG